jgi:acetolactate synthase I/II/III large subunit
MKVADAVAQILKLEGVEYLFAYPVNTLIESAAKVGIRPIIVRQERVGLHMADAFSRVTSGRSIGVFAMQNGPGAENAFGGVAQAFGDSVPIVVIPQGYTRAFTNVPPNFNAALNFRNITKSSEQVILPHVIPDAMRRAFAAARTGRPRPALVEIPSDLWSEEVPEPMFYRPTQMLRSAPDPQAVRQVVDVLLRAEQPVLYAGQGVHYAEAWDALRECAELLEAPVTTSLQGKSAFPENHPLALGSGGRSIPLAVHRFLQNSDVIFGIGCSFTNTGYGIKLPKGKTLIHATLDPADINKDVASEHALVGDARLTLEAINAELRSRVGGKPRGRKDAIAAQIASFKQQWLAQWMPKLSSGDAPLSPYRVIWDLLHTVDVANTIITHDAGSPRDQLSPFWESLTPLSYIGWGKTTQLGYGLGLAMGAKLAKPDKLCINIWGDAAIGFTGMDFETAVRERIPILSILFNNFSMAIELAVMPISTDKYRSTDISGNYAGMAQAFGGYGERVTSAAQIIPAIQRGIAQTQQGTPALLEFITTKETEISIF